MAVVYISEHVGPGLSPGGATAPEEPAIAQQTVAIGGTSTQSSAFNVQTGYVQVRTDAICHVLVGSDPTATTSHKRLAANERYDFTVAKDSALKIAVITGS